MVKPIAAKFIDPEKNANIDNTTATPPMACQAFHFLAADLVCVLAMAPVYRRSCS